MDEHGGVDEAAEVATGRDSEDSNESEIFEEKSGSQVSHRHCKVPKACYHKDPHGPHPESYNIGENDKIVLKLKNAWQN